MCTYYFLNEPSMSWKNFAKKLSQLMLRYLTKAKPHYGMLIFACPNYLGQKTDIKRID